MVKVPDFKRGMMVALFLPMLSSLVLAAFGVYQVRSLLSSVEEVASAYEVGIKINELANSIYGLETGLRGYLLRKDPMFLEPYDKSKIKMPAQIADLQERVSDLKVSSAALEVIKGDLRDWMKFSSEQIAVFTRTGAPPLDIQTSRQGKNLMDKIRDGLETISNRQEAFILQKQRESTTAARQGLALSGLLLIALALLLSFFIYRRFKVISNTYNDALVDQQRSAERLSQMNEQLESLVAARTAELQATNGELEAFCYSVSHDLRAPLRGIDGFSQAVMEDYKDRLDANGVKYLEFIRQGVQKMGRLIDDLLALSRVTRSDVKKESVNLTLLAEEIIQRLRAENPERQCQIDIEPNLIVLGDKGLLGIVLENLLSNAWKFTAKTPEAAIELKSYVDENGSKWFRVKDNGAGFNMQYADKLFGAFQRLHGAQDFHGTGVGLATVKRIIVKHGGNISAHGEVNKGAEFNFTL